MTKNALSQWEKLKQSSQLAQQARDEIKSVLDANYVQTTMMEQETLSRLRQEELQNQIENNQRQAEYYRKQYEETLDRLLKQGQRALPIQPYKSPITQGQPITDKELNDMMEKLLGTNKPKKKKAPKKDVSGLKRLLDGMNGDSK